MEPLFFQVVRVQRKMQLGLFLNRLGQCLLFAQVVAAAAIAVPKIMAIENVPSGWAMWWTTGCLGIGGAAAIAWTWCRGASLLDAAIEIDSRCQLRERVASAFLLSPEHAESSVGCALAADAARAVDRIDIGQYFSIRPSRRAWLPLLPTTFVLLAALWMDPLGGGPPGARGSYQALAPDATQQQMDNAAKVLRKQLTEHRNEAAKQSLIDAESLFRDLEKEVEQLQDPRQSHDRKDRLVKLSDLSRQLADRRRQAGGEGALRKEFEKMKNFGHGPADPFAMAVKDGNLRHATSALEELRKQLEQGTLDDKTGNGEAGSGAMDRLQLQMGRMKDQLLTAADFRQQAASRFMQEFDQARRKGDAAQQGALSKSEQVRRALDPWVPQSGREGPLRAMARQMDACDQCLRQGDRQGAKDAVGNLARQVDQMRREKAKNDLLDEALSQIQAAKDAINGMPGSRYRPSRLGQGRSNEKLPGKFPDSQTGLRRDEPNPTEFRDAPVRHHSGSVSGVIASPAAGPNRRGGVTEAIQREMAAWKSEPADPLVFERLPRSYREHAGQYFNGIREGR